MKDDENNSFEIKGVNGGRDRTRTCDLLRVKQARVPNTMIIEQIFLQESSN
jgi:hypothetical protein